MVQPSDLLSHCDTFFKKGKTNLPGLCALLRLLLQRYHKIFIHGKISLIPASRVTSRDGFHALGLKSAQTCNPNLDCKGFRSTLLLLHVCSIKGTPREATASSHSFSEGEQNIGCPLLLLQVSGFFFFFFFFL